jgi:mono/diheme cytochrome c family protein
MEQEVRVTIRRISQMQFGAASLAIVLIYIAAAVHATARSQQSPAPAQASAPKEGQPSRSVWDGVYTDEQAQRGASLYKQECVACHGQALEGNGEGVNPLTGSGFLAIWNGLTLGDLFDRMRLSMPQNNPGKLTRQQNSDVLAYILSVNRFPSGKGELSIETQRLKEIRFDAIK